MEKVYSTCTMRERKLAKPRPWRQIPWVKLSNFIVHARELHTE